MSCWPHKRTPQGRYSKPLSLAARMYIAQGRSDSTAVLGAQQATPWDMARDTQSQARSSAPAGTPPCRWDPTLKGFPDNKILLHMFCRSPLQSHPDIVPQHMARARRCFLGTSVLSDIIVLEPGDCRILKDSNILVNMARALLYCLLHRSILEDRSNNLPVVCFSCCLNRCHVGN